jgi:hypothetical protein
LKLPTPSSCGDKKLGGGNHSTGRDYDEDMNSQIEMTGYRIGNVLAAIDLSSEDKADHPLDAQRFFSIT